MKTCSRCLQSLDPSSFAPRKSSKDGLHCWCRPCALKYNREFARTPKQQEARKAAYTANKVTLLKQAKARWRERKHLYEPAKKKWAEDHREEMLAYSREQGVLYRAWIDSLKSGRPCLDCMETYPPYIMEFDHVRGVKRYNIGRMTNHKRERVLEEIAKCDLVCCVCHRIRTHTRRVPSEIPKLVAFRCWISSLKAAACVDCGRNRPSVAMDFDHLQDKVIQITDMWSWSRPKVEAEIAKCDLVCANCHRERTVRRIRGPVMSLCPDQGSTAARGVL